jgi:hypothetical protein
MHILILFQIKIKVAEVRYRGSLLGFFSMSHVTFFTFLFSQFLKSTNAIIVYIVITKNVACKSR